MRQSLLWNFVLCLLLLGCGSNSSATNPNVALSKHTVIRYNELLSAGYRKMDMSSLQQVATKEIVVKAFHHMAAIGEGRTKMLSSIKNINFVNIVFPEEDVAKVNTEEKWDYIYINIDTEEVELDNSVDYVMTYRLQKADHTWLVSEITVVDTRHKKEEIHPSFFQRPPDEPQGSVRKNRNEQ